MSEEAVLNRIQRLASKLPVVSQELIMLPWNVDAPYSELNWRNYESGKSIVNTLKECVIPEGKVRNNIRAGFIMPDQVLAETDSESWLFMNGISASKDILNLNGLALANLFHRKINLLFNVSEGVIKDVSGTISGDLSEQSEKISASLCKILENELRKKDKLVLLAHSQGAQICASAIMRLQSRLEKQNKGLELLSRMEFYTFGTTRISHDLPEQVYNEHFINRKDRLADRVRVDISESVPIFQFKKGKGHLLNAHYLPAFEQGRYENVTGKRSRLMSYLPR